MEAPGLLPLSPELRAAARKCWVNRPDVDLDFMSKLHADVSAQLALLGVAHTNLRWCKRAERSVDIAVEGAPPVAIEVDGPTYVLRDGRPSGPARLRNRLLAAHGWRVAVVDYRVWEALATQQQRNEHLRALLAS